MKARVLIVDDSPSQRSVLEEGLRRMGFAVQAVGSGLEALKAVKDDPPDAVILDVVLGGDMDGYAVCRWLRLTETTKDIAVIMLTVRGEVASKVEGLHVGADDYVPKPFDEGELEARIYAALRTKTSQKELRKRNQELEGLLHRVEMMAMTDELTGLFNRRRFVDVLKREWATAHRYKNPLTCLMVDVDHFKRVNDTHGHAFGDVVLRDLARSLSGNLREVDVPARYGGEEFSILLPHTPLSNARLVATRIIERVRQLRLDAPDGAVVPVTVSIGAASNEDGSITTAEALVDRADQALYRAKIQGRNRLVVAETST